MNVNLPLLDDLKIHKSNTEVANRALCVFALLAVSYGYSKEKSIEWLKKEDLYSSLTHTELSLCKDSDFTVYQKKTECLWALAWCLNCFEELNNTEFCDDSLSGFFPKISKGQTTTLFKYESKLTDSKDIYAQADLLYCLHWAMVENQINKKPNQLPIYVIEERRRAIDWILSDEGWDEISLDT